MLSLVPCTCRCSSLFCWSSRLSEYSAVVLDDFDGHRGSIQSGTHLLFRIEWPQQHCRCGQIRGSRHNRRRELRLRSLGHLSMIFAVTGVKVTRWVVDNDELGTVRAHLTISLSLTFCCLFRLTMAFLTPFGHGYANIVEWWYHSGPSRMIMSIVEWWWEIRLFDPPASFRRTACPPSNGDKYLFSNRTRLRDTSQSELTESNSSESHSLE